jgi:hypothetical protein
VDFDPGVLAVTTPHEKGPLSGPHAVVGATSRRRAYAEINACVQSANGNVRIVSSAGACHQTRPPFPGTPSWSREALKGSPATRAAISQRRYADTSERDPFALDGKKGWFVEFSNPSDDFAGTGQASVYRASGT